MWFPKLHTKTREWKQPLNRITSDHIWASAAQSVKGRKETTSQLEEENRVTIVWLCKESVGLSLVLAVGPRRDLLEVLLCVSLFGCSVDL